MTGSEYPKRILEPTLKRCGPENILPEFGPHPVPTTTISRLLQQAVGTVSVF